jgi:hypothetical protein
MLPESHIKVLYICTKDNVKKDAMHQLYMVQIYVM